MRIVRRQDRVLVRHHHEEVTLPEIVGRLGLEPRTNGLKVRCSTIELTTLRSSWSSVRTSPADQFDQSFRLVRHS